MLKHALLIVLLCVFLHELSIYLSLPSSSISPTTLMSWSPEFRQRRAKCLPYQMLRQKVWNLILNDPTKGPWSWDADLNDGTFSITYAQQPQHNINCSNGDFQLLSTWDRDSSQIVLLSWDNPHMPISDTLQSLSRQLRDQYGQPGWHTVRELHSPSSELEKIDDSGSGLLQFSLSLVAIDIASQHTDREWIPYIADTAHLLIRQTPTSDSSQSSPLATSVTLSPQWQRLVRSPMTVLSVFRDCITSYGLVDHFKAFKSYATRIGWLLTEQAGDVGGSTSVHCRLPERGEAGPVLSFDALHRLTNVQFAVGQEDLIS